MHQAQRRRHSENPRRTRQHGPGLPGSVGAVARHGVGQSPRSLPGKNQRHGECGRGPASRGSAEEVAGATRKLLATVSVRGGHILSSGNSISSSVKPENFWRAWCARRRNTAFIHPCGEHQEVRWSSKGRWPSSPARGADRAGRRSGVRPPRARRWCSPRSTNRAAGRRKRGSRGRRQGRSLTNGLLRAPGGPRAHGQDQGSLRRPLRAYNNASVYLADADGPGHQSVRRNLAHSCSPSTSTASSFFVRNPGIPLITVAGGGGVAVLRPGSSASVMGTPGNDAYTASKGATLRSRTRWRWSTARSACA